MILTIVNIIISILLIVAIILQMQGSGISGAFGGTGEFYRSRRSIERLLVWITVVLVVLFGVVSIILLFNH